MLTLKARTVFGTTSENNMEKSENQNSKCEMKEGKFHRLPIIRPEI